MSASQLGSASSACITSAEHRGAQAQWMDGQSSSEIRQSEAREHIQVSEMR